MKYKLINYNECLTNLSNSILRYFDLPTSHSSLGDIDQILEQGQYENVIVLLYDGMGSNIMKKHLDEGSFLIRHKYKDFHSVFPPTTTAATTSFLSGLNPCEHGWIGWDVYIKPIDQTVTLYRNTIKDSDKFVASESVAETFFPYESLISRINQRHQAYQLMPFGEDCYTDLIDMNRRIIELSKRKGKKLIYAYCDQPDHDMHDYGTKAKNIQQLIQKINNHTEELCKSLEQAVVFVIADHGHIECDKITLSDYPDILATLKQDIAIEGRACAFYIKEQEQERFLSLFENYFKEDFILLSKQEVIDQKIFGDGTCHALFESCLGDFLAIGITNKFFRYSDQSVNYVSAHAGMTEDEMLIPLIMINC